MKEMDFLKEYSNYCPSFVPVQFEPGQILAQPCCYQPEANCGYGIISEQKQSKELAASSGYCATCGNYIC